MPTGRIHYATCYAHDLNQVITVLTNKPGTEGCDYTFDIIASLTGKVVARLPFDQARAETKREADLFVDALNALVARGGSLCETSLQEAMVAIDTIELSETSTVAGSPWTIQQILEMRPDLTLVEAYGVLQEAACFYHCGRTLCPCEVNDLAEATFPLEAATRTNH